MLKSLTAHSQIWQIYNRPNSFCTCSVPSTVRSKILKVLHRGHPRFYVNQNINWNWKNMSCENYVLLHNLRRLEFSKRSFLCKITSMLRLPTENYSLFNGEK